MPPPMDLPYPLRAIMRSLRNRRWLYYLLILVPLALSCYLIYLLKRSSVHHTAELKSQEQPAQVGTFRYLNEDTLNPAALEMIRKEALLNEKREIMKEMNGYEYQTGREEDEKTIRNIVVTTWNSGSSFLGEALNAHPGMFYHDEPLEYFGPRQIRSGNLGKKASPVINNLFSCHYKGLEDYMKYATDHHWFLNRNTRLWQYCEKNREVCSDPSFLSEMCKLFPFQTMKTVRYRLRLAKTLLDNSEFNLRMLLLVRDPRATIKDRNERDWCNNAPDCSDPRRLCIDLEDDYIQAQALREKYPDRFLAIRYEDMIANPHEAMKKVLKFFGLQFHPKVEEYLKSHKIFSKPRPFNWRNDYVGNFTLLGDIQKKCNAAMNHWGYLPVIREEDLPTFHIIGGGPWEEMKIKDDSP